jgi:glycosyltransferase involved in cell wall biosynthesis
MHQRDIAVVVSTFERPWHLRRCLASLEAQDGVAGRFEVVVTDDGSQDETLRMVTQLARQVDFPLTFTTHSHEGFRLARCRNEGVAASTAPYVLFTDGDCVLPRNHLRIHLEERRPGWVAGGDCLRLDEATSARITPDVIEDGDIAAFVPRGESGRMRIKAWRAKAYEWLRISMRPRLSGNNIAIWRADYERVNGFDEQFVGWGFEDRDFQQRLERLGVRVRSILLRTTAVHLWHAPAPSFTRNGIGTPNLDYFRSLGRRPTFCVDGLVKPDEPPATIVTIPVSPAATRRAA